MAWKKQIGTILTLSRIAATPPIILLMLMDHFWGRFFAFCIFILASITDYYDGYYARKYDAVSNVGKLLDPIADKILVTSVLIMLLSRGDIDPYLIILLVVRDQLIAGLRSIAAADGLVLDAKPTGKWKTGLQMAAIPALILKEIPGLPLPLASIAYLLLWGSVVLSLLSGIEYFLHYQKAKNNPEPRS